MVCVLHLLSCPTLSIVGVRRPGGFLHAGAAALTISVSWAQRCRRSCSRCGCAWWLWRGPPPSSWRRPCRRPSPRSCAASCSTSSPSGPWTAAPAPVQVRPCCLLLSDGWCGGSIFVVGVRGTLCVQRRLSMADLSLDQTSQQRVRHCLHAHPTHHAPWDMHLTAKLTCFCNVNPG